MSQESNDYVIRVLNSPADVNAADWNALLALQRDATPFMRHEYLLALQASGCATPETGWTPRFILLKRGGALAAACAFYLKTHSAGEYVFDHAWANAYAQHGLAYYPKALLAVPFTPVPGARLLARSAAERALLLQALIQWCKAENLSSLHLLFGSEDDLQACEQAGLMLRHTVQFHWKNGAPTLATSSAALPPEGDHFALGRPGGETTAPTLATSSAALPPEGAHFALGRPGGETTAYADFEDFLNSLSHDKRKKIHQERRKVAAAGVTFRCSVGADIRPADWDFFYRCYERTYLEHGNPPYLNQDFFRRMANDLPAHWLLFVAERKGHPIASSLIALSEDQTGARGQANLINESIAYGRYWGALTRVDCLHFELCYYQPLQWCVEQGYRRFEGGAQGEHKLARALLPVKTSSAHWLAHPAFAQAVEDYLALENESIEGYVEGLQGRSPLRKDR